jgi:hypothetical protein
MNIFRVLSLLITISFLSCNKESKDVLEIYLLKNRIETLEGVPVSELKDTSIKNGLIERFGTNLRYDTITNKVIFAGSFFSKKSDIENQPFITNEEIIGLELANYSICFNKSVDKKISDSYLKWRKENQSGKQFALCRNGAIVLNGYFYNAINNYTSITYQIFYTPNNKNDTIKYLFTNGASYDLSKDKKILDLFKNKLIK